MAEMTESVEYSAIITECARALGYESLKPKQSEAILSFLSGRDTFVSLPTGYGKTVIFALLPMIFNKIRGNDKSIAVCVSPLTSLMVDQQSKFSQKGLSVEFVGKSQNDPAATNRVLQGQVQIVFITPENLIGNKCFREMMASPAYQANLIALIVDEAHCVKTWGDSFRTVFAQIGDIRSIIPSSVCIMALTATATLETFHVVVHRLAMIEPNLIALPPVKKNIYYTVQPKCDLGLFVDMICTGLKVHRKSFPKTLVYVRSFVDCIHVFTEMKRSLGSEIMDPPGCPPMKNHWLVDMFTRVCTDEKKEEILKSFSTVGCTLRVLIATTAFGMGVDCPDIRKVIHWGLPNNKEEYVQETGRCGRDEQPSEAILYRGRAGGRHADSPMKAYYSNDTICRRKLLFQDFLLYSSESISSISSNECCDVCQKNSFSDTADDSSYTTTS